MTCKLTNTQASINSKILPNVRCHIAIRPKYRQNVITRLWVNEKAPKLLHKTDWLTMTVITGLHHLWGKYG